ncbi:MAG: hypothetical protein JWM21_4320 [Acidobacteria bacterium]|nr:hypothetical protein [Acidobacteriota bacterium]
MKRIMPIVLLLLFLASAFVIKTSVRANSTDKHAAEPVAEKWEYLAVAGPSSTNFTPTGEPNMRKEVSSFGREGFVLEQHLDKLGSRGWELISVAGPPNDPVFYFKRRK